MQSRHSSSYSRTGSPLSHALPQEFTTSGSTSGAFGANINLTEDRIDLSDIAERRRMGNRIAQRNYSTLPGPQMIIVDS